MATAISAWFPYVRPDVMQAAPPLLLDAIRNALIEFCESTWIYTTSLASLSSVVGQSAYTLTLPTGTDVVALKSVVYDGSRIDVTSEDELDTLYPSSDWRTMTGVPFRYYQTADMSIIHLFPIPEVAVSNGIRIVSALKPMQEAETVPDFLYQDWRSDIAAGAKSNLFMMTASSWGDPNKAAVFAQQFRQGINRAKMLISKGFGKRQPAVRPHRWWGRLNNA